MISTGNRGKTINIAWWPGPDRDPPYKTIRMIPSHLIKKNYTMKKDFDLEKHKGDTRICNAT